MIRALVLLCLMLGWALPAQAQPVRVTSGEHPGFTRIVLEFPGPVDWRVGRTADGYELRTAEAAPVFDLSGVFDLIGQGRLAAIWADPDTGALSLSVACACHAIPFEFRPGTVVIDLRDGPPPSGSSFENSLEDGNTAAALARPITPRPRARPEDSAETATPASEPEGTKGTAKPQPLPFNLTALPLPVQSRSDGPAIALLDRSLHRPDEAQGDLEPLRQSLIEELSKGATQGIVEMAPPEGPDTGGATHAGTETPEAGTPSPEAPVEIRLGDTANLEIRQKGEAQEPLTAEGVACIEDERLAIGEWAEETPIADQFGPALSGLIGEFDKPDPAALSRAVRFYLHIGFGAEARALLQAFPTDQEDAEIWLGMANILDSRPEGADAFKGMAACNTSAALWALLANPEILALGQVEKAAVLRAFSALPRHLRQALGPRLVERFLAMKDLTSATALRDAVQRGAVEGERTADIELMEAAMEKAGGSPAASEARLEALAEAPGGSEVAVLVALVIQQAELGKSVSYDQVQALESFAREHADSEDQDRMQLALTLAYGASGDFARAFERLEETPDAAPTLWQLLARMGGDTPLLEHAVLPAEEAPPKAARGVATLIAQRLVTLGLADQAAHWLVLEPEPPPALAARVALGQGDPETALRLLGDTASVPADEIRKAAFRALGDERSIAELAAARGETEDHWRAISRLRDWPLLASQGPEAWKEAALRLVGPTATDAAALEPAPAGPLERDRRLVSDSEATRAAISALLDTVEAPKPPTQ